MTATATTCECGGGSSVEETRETSGGRVRRRRKCLKCGKGWRTYEERHPETSFLDAVAAHLDRVCGDHQWVMLRAAAWYER